jgi:tetratricopeptide (TPR) repeat protein
VLRQLGRNTEALVWYRLAAEDEYGGIIYRASSHWRSAEILDRLGRRGEALPHYEHVVELWRDADRELQPFVAKAISRIAEIRRL